MSFLRSRFVQAVLVLVIAFVVLRFGIQPPAPWSVLTLYMSIVLLAVLVFVSSDSDSWRDFVRQTRLVRRRRRTALRPWPGHRSTLSTGIQGVNSPRFSLQQQGNSRK